MLSQSPIYNLYMSRTSNRSALEARLIKHLTEKPDLWNSISRKWAHRALDAGTVSEDHLIWDGVIWLYELAEEDLKELRIIDNPDQISREINRFTANESYDWGQRYLVYFLGQIKSFKSHVNRAGENLSYALNNTSFGSSTTAGPLYRVHSVYRGINRALLSDLINKVFSGDSLLCSLDNIAMYDFLHECGEPISQDIKRYMRFIDAGCFISFMSYGLAIVCKRPRYIKTFKDRLHCDDGPAIEWADGSRWYCLNGVRVPHQLITLSPGDFDPRIILMIENAEVRKEIVRKIGIENLISRLNGQLLDRWNGYELIKLNMPGMQIVPVYLKMTNPSTGAIHVEGVPPEIATCREALSWRVEGTDWNPEQLT